MALVVHRDELTVVLADDPAPLSVRQGQAIALAALGYSNRRIGAILGIKHDTVRGHLSRAISALNTNNRAHAIATAARTGILTITSRS
jgi:DNA-binding CsgD family transcriptional regulator